MVTTIDYAPIDEKNS